MVNPFFQLIVADAAFKVYPVPVLLIEVICACYFGVLLPELDGQFRIAFQADPPAVFRQVEQGKHLPGHFKDQGSIVKREAFGDSFFGDAVFSDFFCVHGYLI